MGKANVPDSALTVGCAERSCRDPQPGNTDGLRSHTFHSEPSGMVIPRVRVHSCKLVMP
jgi:hypothetical protein